MGICLAVKRLYSLYLAWIVNVVFVIIIAGEVIMTFDELESELVNLMSLPMKGNIQINFDEEDKIFSLSIPIFNSGLREIPLAVQKYVASLAGMSFRPHLTSYQHLESLNQVHLVQKIPFSIEGQSSLRSQLGDFWELSKTCHTMLCEMAAEEKLELFEA